MSATGYKTCPDSAGFSGPRLSLVTLGTRTLGVVINYLREISAMHVLILYHKSNLGDNAHWPTPC